MSGQWVALSPDEAALLRLLGRYDGYIWSEDACQLEFGWSRTYVGEVLQQIRDHGLLLSDGSAGYGAAPLSERQQRAELLYIPFSSTAVLLWHERLEEPPAWRLFDEETSTATRRVWRLEKGGPPSVVEILEVWDALDSEGDRRLEDRTLLKSLGVFVPTIVNPGPEGPMLRWATLVDPWLLRLAYASRRRRRRPPKPRRR